MSVARIGRVRMKGGGADVRVLHTPQPEPALDIIRKLRAMADNMASGRFPEVDSVVAVAENANGSIEVFLWGCAPGDNLPHTVGLLHLAIERVTRIRLAPFENPETIGSEL